VRTEHKKRRKRKVDKLQDLKTAEISAKKQSGEVELTLRKKPEKEDRRNDK